VPDSLKCVFAFVMVHAIVLIVTPGAICRLKPIPPVCSAPGGFDRVALEHPIAEAAVARLKRIAWPMEVFIAVSFGAGPCRMYAQACAASKTLRAMQPRTPSHRFVSYADKCRFRD
jgi:hypothetical protein